MSWGWARAAGARRVDESQLTMPMPRLRTGGAEAAVSEAFGGGGPRRGGAPDDAVTVPTAQGRLHAGDTLVRHTLQQADVEVHPAGGAAARVSGSRGGGGAARRRPAATHSSHSTVTPSIFLNGRAADVCHSCGLRRIRLLSVSRMRLSAKRETW